MEVIASSFDRLVERGWHPRDQLTVVAGENGCGKSQLLRSIALDYLRQGSKVVALAGSVHDKFKGLDIGGRHFAPNRAESEPETVVKNAIVEFQRRDKIQLRTLSRLLQYCRFDPVVGVRVNLDRDALYKMDVRRLVDSLQLDWPESEDLHALVNVLHSGRFGQETYWVDFDARGYEFSSDRLLASLVAMERHLVKLGLIRGISLSLRRQRNEIPLKDASSGELSLIASLVFISSMIRGADLVLIDEPENSLHPRWQRDYLDLVSAAMGYNEARVIIATHSPILVLATLGRTVSTKVLVLSDTFEEKVELEASSLEQVLAEVFHAYTPRNSYLSATLVELMNKYEEGRISLEDVARRLQAIKESGIDDRQLDALQAVWTVVEQGRERL
ncbi:AAA family ATPase [Stenotrophomonas maltophilia]|jgi:ABC-type cobalamin/Fe3+-siderophores transport system ATPase subunit|uniref:ATP-binding protein n=1 Tax=Stenotrophomonas maltophilia TaxID=40324 RepID=UPI0009AE0DD3|nr:ATP-binding protein [Stenotrophomonas maltophilia]MBA0462127.1 hypothetical protein [Stenotrophomonas maltophilia]MBC8772659.1 AAA family ATPase [Stenotrophomonas maltophilia]MBH1610837.1 AAA family ATPase [Stenotrophomonas maltophilia]MBH1724578.1 AAA family ATPase [Stenotrophomonas maltophilia]MBH1797418.1 AAA family ATPase [Stenotrophomonas maltophilia]